ncbi:hypothetical protein HMI56_001335 [Coelomomyces lativittatus]|nr:hypothetical protein HMI56_001335 [Coelomomyces lativittatus]
MSTTSSTSQAGDLPKPFPPTAPDSSQPSPPPSTLQYAKTYVYPIYVTLDPMQPLHIQTDQVIRKFHQGKLPLEFELVTFSKHKRRKKEVHSSDSNGEEVFSSTSNSSDLADDEEEDADEEDENDADEEEDEEDVEEEEDEEEEEVGEEEENGDEDDEDEEATEEEEGDVREGTKELDRVFCDPSNSFLDGLLKKYPPHSSSSSNQGAETEEASSPSNSSKKRKGLRRRYKEEWYDSDDSFIDDSGEFRDNVGLMRTVRTGFFLQEGPIDVVPLAGVNKVTESLSKPKPTLTISTISTPSSENEEIQQEIQNFKLLANPLDWSQKSVFPSVLKEPLYKLVERFFLLHQTVPSTSFLIAVTRTMPYNLYTIKRYIARHCIGRYQQQELLPRIETLFSKLKENSVETWNAENFSSVSQDRESEEGVIKKRRVHLTGDLKRLLNEILQIEKFSFELTSWKEYLIFSFLTLTVTKKKKKKKRGFEFLTRKDNEVR